MTLPDPQEQARRFARVREAHRTEMQEDYVELIGDLIAATGEARAADLAERFGVTAATVTNTLSRLRKAGLIEMQPYRSIFLTEEGKAMAATLARTVMRWWSASCSISASPAKPPRSTPRAWSIT